YAPVFVVLVLVFKPDLHPRPLELVVFFFAIWGAYVIRTINNFILGMVTIWTTRAAAIFELWFLSELLLSGRLLPLQLMPEWLQSLTWLFPFKWTFSSPIQCLAGGLSTGELLRGLGTQLLWMGICAPPMRIVGRLAARHYTAVGN